MQCREGGADKVFLKRFARAFKRDYHCRHNVQTVQLWYGRHGGRIGYASGPLEKLIQASQLLQIPKTLSNIPVICDELTTELSSAQVSVFC